MPLIIFCRSFAAVLSSRPAPSRKLPLKLLVSLESRSWLQSLAYCVQRTRSPLRGTTEWAYPLVFVVRPRFDAHIPRIPVFRHFPVVDAPIQLCYQSDNPHSYGEPFGGWNATAECAIDGPPKRKDAAPRVIAQSLLLGGTRSRGTGRSTAAIAIELPQKINAVSPFQLPTVGRTLGRPGQGHRACLAIKQSKTPRGCFSCPRGSFD